MNENKWQMCLGKHIGKGKKVIKNATTVILVTGLIVYPLHLSYTGAYFTDKAFPGGSKADGRTRTSHDSDVIKLFFDIHKFSSLDVILDVEDNILLAQMSIPSDSGFSTEDIIIEIIKLTYNGSVTEIAPSEVNPSGNQLSLVFDWDQALDFNNNNETLYVSISGRGAGGGLSGLGEKYIFDGYGKLMPPPPEEETSETAAPLPTPPSVEGTSDNPTAPSTEGVSDDMTSSVEETVEETTSSVEETVEDISSSQDEETSSSQANDNE